MKILIIHQHFRTPTEGGAIRSYYLAKAMLQHGHSVIVVTGGAVGTNLKFDYEGIEVHRLAIPYSNNFGFWQRGKSFMRFALDAIRLAKSLEGIDLCYTISVPLTTGIVAIALKRSRNIPYFFEVGDLWPDAPIELGIVKNPLLKQMLRVLENMVYRRAKSVIALSPPIADAIKEDLRGKLTPIYLIPNMADTAFFQPRTKEGAIQENNSAGRFVVSYIGAIGFANGLDFFIECARAAMQKDLAIKFLVCGEGAILSQHKENVRRLQLNNLEFIPFTNRDGVRDVLNVTDAVFVCYKPFKILETGSPNKYFDGLAAGKLIVINFEGWIKEEVEANRCGVYVDKQNPLAFASVISPFIEQRQLLSAYQQSARKLAESKYSRTLLGDRLQQVLNDYQVTRK